MKYFLPLLLFCSLGYSQNTVKSLASEYFYQDLSSSSEWLERDISIGKETIVIKSYGKDAMEYQTWEIQNSSNIKHEDRALEVFNVHLASGEEYEFPATFTVLYDSEGKVESITCEIPPNSQMKLADGSPVSVRFLID